MPPTDLSRCDEIPGLRRDLSEWEQRFADLGRRPFSRDQLQDDDKRLSDLRREHGRLLDRLYSDQRPKDPRKLAELLGRNADLESEMRKIRNRFAIDEIPPNSPTINRWRQDRERVKRDLEELEKSCTKFVTEREHPDADNKENISSTKNQDLSSGTLQDRLGQDTDAIADILQKPVAAITQGEINELMDASDFGQPTDRGHALAMKARAWFDHVWGKQPVARDDTGRAVDAAPVNLPPDRPTPLRDPDGRPVGQTLLALGAELDRIVADPESRDDEATVVRALQRATNWTPRLARSPTAPKEGRGGRSLGIDPQHLADLKVDGLLGRKTRARTRRAVARLGRDKFREGLALGRFQEVAEQVTADDSAKSGLLRREVENSFGPLFQARPSSVSRSDLAPKPETVALQDALNDLGQQRHGSELTPLKTDGLVGPKTTEAFKDAIRRFGAESVTSAFGHCLGFLDADEDAEPTPELGFDRMKRRVIQERRSRLRTIEDNQR